MFRILLFLLFSSLTMAEIPTTMPFQGFLTETNVSPVTATLPISFSLYVDSTTTTVLWQEDYPAVNVTTGVFEVQLGSVVPLTPPLFNSPLFLGIAVNGDTEMSPRTAVGSVAFSFASGQVMSCGTGLDNCSGICTSLLTDDQNCGLCGNNCDDGDLCTVAESCDGNGMCISTPINCSDGVACTADICASNSGLCTNTPTNSLCDDGDQCTADTCDVLLGCAYSNEPNGTSCDDGDLCTINALCNNGTCSGIPVDCDDGNMCTSNLCNPSSGDCISSNVSNGTICDNGSCQNGICFTN